MNEIVKYDEKIFTPVGLILPETITFDEWLALAPILRLFTRASLWWWGDYLNIGERKWGEMYTQALEESDYSYETLRHAKWICKEIDLCRRRHKLPFSFHQEVAELDKSLQDTMLYDCEDEGWNRQELRSNIKQYKRNLLSLNNKDKSIDIDFRLGDFEEVFADIEDGSVDCIITDPPYPIEFIECWTNLSRFAKRVLKENGFCIAYSGQMNLPEVINRMSENLTYYWTFAVYHEGLTQIVNGVNLICRWKPILIYQNGRKKLSNTFQDYFISEAREKNEHDWQQSESGVSYLIEMFTNPGELIIDPFAGSGTTLIAAHKMGRNVKGAEIDETTYNIAKSKLHDNTKI